MAATVLELLRAAVAAVGGAERPGQVLMAAAVENAIESGEHLLVQAGTGTGKSLAYLVPAIEHGKRVVVATATLALQAQLAGRDLPMLTAAVTPALGRSPTYAILKGRANYACLHRIHTGVPDEQGMLVEVAPSSPIGREVVRVREWLDESETGDRDDLVPGVSDRAWGQVSVSARECLGAERCPYGAECFAERARNEARHSDIVITNHALLAIDALHGRTVLPEHEVVIVDEAHELVARVTGAATAELTSGLVERAARWSRQLAGEEASGALEEAGEALREALLATPVNRLDVLPGELTAALALVRDTARTVTSALGKVDRDAATAAAAKESGADSMERQVKALVGQVFDVATRLVANDAYDVIWLEDRVRGGLVLRVAPLSVAGLLRDGLFADRTVVLTSATLALGGEFEPVARGVGLEPSPFVASDSSSTGSERTAAAVVSPGSSRGEADGPLQSSTWAESWRRSAPETALDVTRPNTRSDGEHGDAGPVTNVGRGATPSTPSSGAGDAAEKSRKPSSWVGLDVGSPFDYSRQGILYIARHLPSPGREGPGDEMLAELLALMTAAGGRTLGLFSSRRAAEAAAFSVREQSDLPVLCQGEDGLAELGRQFAEDPRTSLFGTLSLWQGIDVPGATCQLVVIDRIPFPRPDDPMSSARAKAVTEAGGNGFMAVAAAHAALLLAQGSGRLIRTSADRGVVAVLDARLATARYREFLLRTMPPMWRTTDREAVLGALRRLDAAAPERPAAAEGAVAPTQEPAPERVVAEA